MGEDSNLDLEHLTERVAEEILFTIGAAHSDPKQAHDRLLGRYLEQAQEQAYDEALRDQQN